MEPINIFSGAETRLGAALTNPTHLACQKRTLDREYPVVFDHKRYPDVETAYKVLKGEEADDNDELMVDLISAKFRQHPELAQEVRQRGGAPFLRLCRHWTGAHSERYQSWEGDGMQSRFIRNLVGGYEKYEQGDASERGQNSLF